MRSLNIIQHSALQAIHIASATMNKGIVVMPTGTGKTFLAVTWVQDILQTHPTARILFVCHSNDILSQANEREFKQYITQEHISFGYYTAYKKQQHQITFATVQTLVNHLKDFSPTYFDYVIVDEVHHYQANLFKKALLYFHPKFLLGLTATPTRSDNKSLFEVAGTIIYQAHIKDAIQLKLLSNVQYYSLTDNIDYSSLSYRRGKGYKKTDLNKLLCIPQYDKMVLDQYQQIKKEHNRTSTICFCATIEHAHRMGKLFSQYNISNVVYTGIDRKTSLLQNKKEQQLHLFRSGQCEIIFVVNLFNEGVDIPECDMLIFLRPTLSNIVFTQQLGRGLRKSPNKEYTVILDFCGNSYRCEINLDVILQLTQISKEELINYTKTLPSSVRDITYTKYGNTITIAREKVDIFERSQQRSNSQILTTTLAILEELCAKNKKLSRSAVEKYGQSRGITKRLLYTHIPDWNTFLQEHNYFPKYGASKQDIMRYFRQWPAHEVNLEWMRKHSYYQEEVIIRAFGSYVEFRKQMGWPDYQKRMSKADVIKKYKSNTKAHTAKNLEELSHILQISQRQLEYFFGSLDILKSYK